jgi:hypothetical protein
MQVHGNHLQSWSLENCEAYKDQCVTKTTRKTQLYPHFWRKGRVRPNTSTLIKWYWWTRSSCSSSNSNTETSRPRARAAYLTTRLAETGWKSGLVIEFSVLIAVPSTRLMTRRHDLNPDVTNLNAMPLVGGESVPRILTGGARCTSRSYFLKQACASVSGCRRRDTQSFVWWVSLWSCSCSYGTTSYGVWWQRTTALLRENRSWVFQS